MRKLFLISLLSAFCCSSFAQTEEFDFENWEEGKPVGWYEAINIVQAPGRASISSCKLKSSYDGVNKYASLKGRIKVDFTEIPQFFSFYLKADLGCPPSYLNTATIPYLVNISYEGGKGFSCVNNCLQERIDNLDFPDEWTLITLPLIHSGNIESVSLEDAVITIEFQLWDNTANQNAYAMIDGILFSDEDPRSLFIYPAHKDILICGTTDTVKWKNGPEGENLILSYSTDNGTSYRNIGIASPGSVGELPWDVPAGLLSDKCRLKLAIEGSGEVLDSSKIFYIKPYLLTRLESNGELTGYNIWSDPWGFENDKEDVWPDWYFNQFNYNGIDEYTGQLYDHLQGDSVFFSAKPEDYPGWKNYVEAYSVPTCYDDLITALYNHKALLSWKNKKYQWNGSCFGIAASNALAFESKNDFLNAYPNFGNFAVPYTVSPGMGTVATVTELFTHQYGNPSIYNDIAGNGLKTPTQTVEDIKKMFSTGHTEIRTLTMYNNSGSGGHTIVPYKLEQDTVNEQYYYIYVYDNEIPDSTNARIRVDVSANGGVGSWEPLYGWSGWGGDKDLYLEIPSSYYYVNATLKKATSYYSLLDSLIEISPNDGANIRIKNVSGITSGYMDDQLLEEIPDVHALMHKDGSESPPYSYLVPAGEYTIDISNPENKAAEGYVFTKDQLFYYERKNTSPEQTDRLLYNGSLTAINPDDEARNIKMMLILEEDDEEKVFKLQPFKLEADDSVKVESPDNHHVILSNYGSVKQYGVELHHVSSSGFERFVNDQITIEKNTSHRFIINWTDVEESVLTVYVDNEMDGSYEDTLLLARQSTGIDMTLSIDPAVFRLNIAPNPAKEKVIVSYRLPEPADVTLKIFDIMGKEIDAPLSEMQYPGDYKIPVYISKLPAGIYIFRMNINGAPVSTRLIKL